MVRNCWFIVNSSVYKSFLIMFNCGGNFNKHQSLEKLRHTECIYCPRLGTYKQQQMYPTDIFSLPILKSQQARAHMLVKVGLLECG